MDAWEMQTDVVVVGSGGSGLTAAILASDQGAQVTVLEKAPLFGGTTNLSGGLVWIACNSPARAAGISDCKEDARTYLMRLTEGNVAPELVDAFIDEGAPAIDYLNAHTPVQLALCHMPDYHAEFAGAKTHGRVLDNEIFDAKLLGEYADKVPMSSHFASITYREAESVKAFGIPENVPFELIAQRHSDDIRTLGSALVCSLMKGCLDRGISLRHSARVRKLVREPGGRILGVEVEIDGIRCRVRANKAVILASGGFEWNADLRRRFLRGPVMAQASVPTNEGDMLVAAMAVGAAVENMSQAWWYPLSRVPGDEFLGKPVFRLMRGERVLPGGIFVNRRGKRYVDEAHNYNDTGKVYHHFDPVAYEYPNIPAWLVFDGRYRRRYGLLTVPPGGKTPSWLAHADTLRDLAVQVGIDPDGLEATVARFNRFAREGKDPDFHRGEPLYDRYYGDPRVEPNASLAPLDEPPYFALPVYAGTIGTKGGPQIDAKARVLDLEGKPIPGLYAAGNVCGSPMGPGYAGGGATIGLGLTFGYLAGRAAGQEPGGGEG